MARQSVLFLTYYFAPFENPGTRRITAFKKYLPEYGYKPIVLTTDMRGVLPDDEVQRIFRAGDLLGVIGKRYRAFALRSTPLEQRAKADAIAPDSWLSQLLAQMMIPDMHVLWFPLAVLRGLMLLQAGTFRAIVSSSPPPTNHLVALALQRITGVPWIADFRDGWLFDPINPYLHKPSPRRTVEGAMERLVVQSADHVLTINNAITHDLQQRYPQAARRITTLSNGYDAAHFQGLTRSGMIHRRLQIVYTGSFSLSRTTISPEPFFQALSALHVAAPAIAAEIELVLIGTFSQQEQQMIQMTHLNGAITVTGLVPHRQSIQQQIDADVLLLLGPTGSSSVTTSKIFEYLATGRPILALTGNSPAAQLVREFDAGIVVEPDDIAGIQATLIHLHARWKANDLPTRHDPRIERFDRRRLTGDLAAILDSL